MPSRLKEYPVGTTTPTVVLLDAGVLHLGHQPRQRRLRGRRREDQQELAAEVPQQAEDVHAGGQLEDGAEHHEHEHRAGEVEGEHQDREALQGVDAGLAHDPGDGAERADGSDPHDHRQHPEHHALEVLDAAEHRLAAAAHRLHREADEQRDQQGLQHLALGQRGEQRRRDHPEDEVRRAAGLTGLLGAGLGDVGGQVQARAGVDAGCRRRRPMASATVDIVTK